MAAAGDAPKVQPDGLGEVADNSWFAQIGNIDYTSAQFVIACVLVITAATIYFWIRDLGRRGVGGAPGGLNYVVGPMGSGKSMFGVRRIIAAVMEGKYVVTNCRLLPGWAERVCEKHYKGDWKKPARRRARVAQLEGFYVFERSLRQAMRYRPPCASCGADVRECGHVGPEQEGRAIFVWDETHNDLNNRDYAGHGSDRQEREEEKERRRLVVRWATQLRKLGFIGYLLSQHHENTDAQLRRVCNFIIRLQNQRNAEGVWIARLLPRRWTLFLVYWYPAHLADGRGDKMLQASRRERYWLPWERHLYDSWETFHGVDDLTDDDAPIVLPAGGRKGREAPPTGGVRPGPPAAAAAALSLPLHRPTGQEG